MKEVESRYSELHVDSRVQEDRLNLPLKLQQLNQISREKRYKWKRVERKYSALHVDSRLPEDRLNFPLKLQQEMIFGLWWIKVYNERGLVTRNLYRLIYQFTVDLLIQDSDFLVLSSNLKHVTKSGGSITKAW